VTEKAALILTQRIMEMVPPGEREDFATSDAMPLIVDAVNKGWPFMLWRKGKKKYELRILVLKNKKKPK